MFSPGTQFSEIPVFPLPRVVLFPGALLPLHIFEPRYRAMTEAALSGNRLICMVNILEDAPVGAAQLPALARIAGLGEIVDHEKLPNGHYALLLVGRCRVNLKELEFQAPFRRACASVLTSIGSEPTETDRAVLRMAIGRQVSRVRGKQPDFEFECPAEAPTSQWVDLCGQHLISEHRVRQELLETLDINRRFERCVAALLDEAAPARRDVN